MSAGVRNVIITQQAGIVVDENTFSSSVTNFSSYYDLFVSLIQLHLYDLT